MLNIVLLGGAVFPGIQWHNKYEAAKAREAATLRKQVKPTSTPPVTPLPQAPPVLPSSYEKVAQETLFDRSRNPVVEVVKEVPPPKPVPPFPVLKGLMN